MKTKVFTKNEKDKIEFTEKELKALLDEIYNEGYNDGKNRSYVYTTPYTLQPWSQYRTWCTTDSTVAKGVTTTATTAGTSSSTLTIKGDK